MLNACFHPITIRHMQARQRYARTVLMTIMLSYAKIRFSGARQTETPI
jgi:hypothetical protein